jgi:hypothetical protein
MASHEMIAAGVWHERYTFSPGCAGNVLFIAGTTAVDESGQLVGPRPPSGARSSARPSRLPPG